MNCRSLSDNEMEITTESSEETELLGFLLGGLAVPGLAILLYGGLGVGKTTFTRGIGRALGIKKIKSPSFILISEHSGGLPLAHADLYRLDREEDVDGLDLESYVADGFLLVVEWAERWLSERESDKIEIKFMRNDENPAQRIIRLKAAGSRAENIKGRLSREMGG